MSSDIFGYALIESPSLNLGTKNDRASQNRYNESQNRNPNPKPLCTTKTIMYNQNRYVQPRHTIFSFLYSHQKGYY